MGNRFKNEVRGDEDDEGEYIDNYKLQREIKTQIKLLREDIDINIVKYYIEKSIDLVQ